MTIQGSITVRRRSVATTYWLVPSVTQIKKSASGTLTPASVTCRKMKRSGTDQAVVTTEKTLRYQKYPSGNETAYTSAVTVTASDTYIVFRLYDGSELIDEVTVSVVSDGANGGKGDPGAEGRQGLIVRQTEWAKGFQYRNDEEATTTTDGLRYLDFALVPYWGGDGKKHYYIFKCKKTHNSSDVAAPYNGMAETAYWVQISTALQPVYYPIVLADQGVFQLAQTNMMIVMRDDDPTKINAAFSGGQNTMWIGAETFNDANFAVDRDGRARLREAEVHGKIVSGVTDGQRIEVDPDRKAMTIHDASGNEVASFEGNTAYALGALMGGATGTLSLTNASATKQVTGNSAQVVTDNGTLQLAAFMTDAPVQIVVSGSLTCTYTEPSAMTPDTGSRPGADTMIPSFEVGSGSATVRIQVRTYADNNRRELLGTTVIASHSTNGTRNMASLRGKTSSGGYHVVEVYYSLSSMGNSSGATARWNITSMSYNSDYYATRYMANGIFLGRSTDNYIWLYEQFTGGMCLEMVNAGFGVRLANGMMQRKHYNEWVVQPVPLFHGRIQYASNAYSISNARYWGGTAPTVSRPASGQVRFTFPSTWTATDMTLAMQNLRVNVTPLGNGYAYVNAIERTYINIYTSTGDLSFMLDIDYLG